MMLFRSTKHRFVLRFAFSGRIAKRVDLKLNSALVARPKLIILMSTLKTNQSSLGKSSMLIERFLKVYSARCVFTV